MRLKEMSPWELLEELISSGKQGDEEKAKKVGERCKALGLLDNGDENGVTALGWASKNGHVGTVAALLGLGADTGCGDEDDWHTPLHWAPTGSVAELLLQAGADPNAQTRDRATPLCTAAHRGAHSTVSALLAAGANAFVTSGAHRLSPLCLARLAGHRSVCRTLEEHLLQHPNCTSSSVPVHYAGRKLYLPQDWWRQPASALLEAAAAAWGAGAPPQAFTFGDTSGRYAVQPPGNATVLAVSVSTEGRVWLWQSGAPAVSARAPFQGGSRGSSRSSSSRAGTPLYCLERCDSSAPPGGSTPGLGTPGVGSTPGRHRSVTVSEAVTVFDPEESEGEEEEEEEEEGGDYMAAVKALVLQRSAQRRQQQREPSSSATSTTTATTAVASSEASPKSSKSEVKAESSREASNAPPEELCNEDSAYMAAVHALVQQRAHAREQVATPAVPSTPVSSDTQPSAGSTPMSASTSSSTSSSSTSSLCPLAGQGFPQFPMQVPPSHRSDSVSLPPNEPVEPNAASPLTSPPSAGGSTTPLHEAVASGEVCLVELLLDTASPQNNNFVNYADGKGRTPLMWGCIGGCLPVVQLLLAKGATTHVRDSEGRTAVFHAAVHGRNDVLRFFAGRVKGTSFHALDNQGHSMVQWAAYNGYLSTLRYLVEVQNVRLDLPDYEDRLAIHWAARQNRCDVLRYLIQRGTVVFFKDKTGMTPEDHAMQQKHWEAVAVLREARLVLHGAGHSEQWRRSVASAMLSCSGIVARPRKAADPSVSKLGSNAVGLDAAEEALARRM